MDGQFNQITAYEILKNLFSSYRIIDFKSNKIIKEFYKNPNKKHLVKLCYEQLEKERSNCEKQNTPIYKIIEQKNLLLFCVLMPIIKNDETVVVECVANITEKVEINFYKNFINNTYRLLITDELTGVYNRRYIKYTLPLSIELSVEKKNPLSLIFIDLDNFKNINDMFGHGAGDYILNQFSINTQKFIKNDVDWIARYGGDEFLICLNNTNYERAKQIANKIKDKTNEKNFIYKTKNIKLTCSLGVYTYSDYDNLIDLNEIIHRVDKILYKAKCEGRNCVM